MPNVFQAIGLARPAITETMRDIEERPRREQLFNKQMAISQLQYEDLLAKSQERKRQDAWLNERWDIRTHPKFMGLSQATQNLVVGNLSQAGITDKNGIGTRRNILKYFGDLKQNPEALGEYIDMEIEQRYNAFQKANEALTKIRTQPDRDPEKVSKAEKDFEDASKAYNVALQSGKDKDTAIKMKRNYEAAQGFLKYITDSGEFDKLSNPEKQIVVMGALYGGLDGIQKVWGKIVEARLKPEKEEKKEKLDFKYFTNKKGEVTRITTNPITGEIIRKEFLGELEKGEKPEKQSEFDKKMEMARKELEQEGVKNIDDTKIAKKMKQMFGEEDWKKVMGEDRMRNEFNNRQEIKNFREIERNQVGLEKAMQQFKKGGNEIAVAIAFVNFYQRMVDPGAVVRVEEFRQIPAAQAVINKIEGFIRKGYKGGIGLTASDYQAIKMMAKRIYEGNKEVYQKVRKDYSKRATARGWSSEQVVGFEEGQAIEEERPLPSF